MKRSMKPYCPDPQCSAGSFYGPKPELIIRKGYFFRSSDAKKIRRFQCKACQRCFSHASRNSCLYQKKRRINSKLNELLCSGVSIRRSAIILKVSRSTVVRRMRFLAKEARKEHLLWSQEYYESPLNEIQFDDLETSEHSKCKPLSVALAVDPSGRKILSFKVSQMPAKGLLSKKALKKYGYRKDLRGEGWDEMMRELKHYTHKNTIFISDENPHYPRFIKKHHPDAIHIQTKGGRGCITGQGELKKLHFDPLFSLNHTCAMLRANLNRLFRKTWCTTKNRQGLVDHLSLFVVYFNQKLTIGAECEAS